VLENILDLAILLLISMLPNRRGGLEMDGFVLFSTIVMGFYSHVNCHHCQSWFLKESAGVNFWIGSLDVALQMEIVFLGRSI
jgi:hypothetical protein